VCCDKIQGKLEELAQGSNWTVKGDHLGFRQRVLPELVDRGIVVSLHTATMKGTFSWNARNQFPRFSSFLPGCTRSRLLHEAVFGTVSSGKKICTSLKGIRRSVQ
jgi:hypothetical protein